MSRAASPDDQQSSESGSDRDSVISDGEHQSASATSSPRREVELDVSAPLSRGQQEYEEISTEMFPNTDDGARKLVEALNKKDNDTAFSHFARAVYNFDSFFSTIGLNNLEQ